MSSAEEQIDSPPPAYPGPTDAFPALRKGQAYAEGLTAEEVRGALEGYFRRRRSLERSFNTKLCELQSKRKNAERRVTREFMYIESELPRVRAMDSSWPKLRKAFEGLRSWTWDLTKLTGLYCEALGAKDQEYKREKRQLQKELEQDLKGLEDGYSRLVHGDFLRQLHVRSAVAKRWQRSKKEPRERVENGI